MVLPSNIKNVSDIENKSGHYTTYLPKTITVDKTKWKVAVVDLSYMKTWFNITEENSTVVAKRGGEIVAHGRIPLARYGEAGSLVSKINKILDTKIKSQLVLDPAENIVIVSTFAGEEIILNKITASMLGHSTYHFNNDTTQRIEFVPTRSANLSLPTIQNIYLYSNIVDHVVVGDSYVPLLQVVPVPTGEYGSVQHVQFLVPLYMTLISSDISVIELKLCDDRGNIIEFDFGDVIVKLHFKRVQ